MKARKHNLVPIWTPLYWHRHLLRNAVNRLCAHISGGRVIDLGCGASPYRDLIEAFSDEYIGADINSGDQGQINIEPIREVIETEDESFETVSHFQVMEHVPDYQKFLDECFRIVKPGGLVIATVPFVFEFHAVPNDYRRWTHEGLVHDFEAAGFTVVDVFPVERDWVSLLVIIQLHVANIFGLRFTKLLFLLINLLGFFLHNWGPEQLPLTNGIVCRKPDRDKRDNLIN